MSGKRISFFGDGIPYHNLADLTGKLIVIEGTDGVGRSTQIEDLKKWLEVKVFGVMTTGWTRSPLIGKTIEKAKAGHGLNINTFNLLYAADLADRLQPQIIPALKSGFLVLPGTYINTGFR